MTCVICLDPNDAITVDGPAKMTYRHRTGRQVRMVVEAPDATRIRHIRGVRPTSSDQPDEMQAACAGR